MTASIPGGGCPIVLQRDGVADFIAHSGLPVVAREVLGRLRYLHIPLGGVVGENRGRLGRGRRSFGLLVRRGCCRGARLVSGIGGVVLRILGGLLCEVESDIAVVGADGLCADGAFERERRLLTAPEMAARYCDSALLLGVGRIVDAGGLPVVHLQEDAARYRLDAYRERVGDNRVPEHRVGDTLILERYRVAQLVADLGDFLAGACKVLHGLGEGQRAAVGVEGDHLVAAGRRDGGCMQHCP